MCTGVELIAAERRRQIEKYRWDDTGNDSFQLTDCALMIAQDVAASQVEGVSRPDNYWPTERAEHVKEKYSDDHIARLAIAGALIAAEIDRLQGTPFESQRVLISRTPVNANLLQALEDVMRMIEVDDLIPESVSYMKQARQAIADAKGGA